MISCPNCNHQNPDGAVQCEACYTNLPQTESCPQCGASIQSNAAFCGQCGFNIKANLSTKPASLPDIPETAVSTPSNVPEIQAEIEAEIGTEIKARSSKATIAMPTVTQTQPVARSTSEATQIQIQTAVLLHIQTNILIELPSNLTVVHLGKPNDIVPPDIDVSGFPNSEVVSRVHADIRIEAGLYFIEDTGSSNGTYVNHVPLPEGNLHRLRAGDRIALGKGDKVTFLFQLT